MDDKASLRNALKGAYAVYSVTNFWDHMDPEREKTQGINVADAAAVSSPCNFLIIYIYIYIYMKLTRTRIFQELGVQHFIYSSLRNITESGTTRPLLDPAACMHAYLWVLTRYHPVS